MKLIITGATGSLGAFLTRHFSLAGHQVIACGRDIKAPANLLKYATYHHSDISRPHELPQADACIHTAALSDDKASSEQLFQPNVMGTKFTAEATNKCSHFIHISSSSVYLPDVNPITEDMAGKQNNAQLSPYGTSKLLAEQMLEKTSSHHSCFILRPRAFYGAGDRVILPRLLKLVNKEVFQRPGKMQIKVSLTHYENIAEAVNLCLHSNKKGFHIYNVADEKEYIFVEVIRKLLAEMYGRNIPEKEISIWILRALALFKVNGITPLLVRSFSKDMVLDISKIKKELNYKAVADFDSKLLELGNWVRNIGGVEAIRTGKKEFAWT